MLRHGTYIDLRQPVVQCRYAGGLVTPTPRLCLRHQWQCSSRSKCNCTVEVEHRLGWGLLGNCNFQWSSFKVKPVSSKPVRKTSQSILFIVALAWTSTACHIMYSYHHRCFALPVLRTSNGEESIAVTSFFSQCSEIVVWHSQRRSTHLPSSGPWLARQVGCSWAQTNNKHLPSSGPWLARQMRCPWAQTKNKHWSLKKNRWLTCRSNERWVCNLYKHWKKKQKEIVSNAESWLKRMHS